MPHSNFAEITISCGSNGIELELCREGAESWAKKNNQKVRVITTTNSSSERLALYQQMLAAGSSDIDVYQIDVVWPGILQNHFEDLTSLIPENEQKDFFPESFNNNIIDGKLVAIPWFMDAGILYYRKDLLEKYNLAVPQSWEALEAAAKNIMASENQNKSQSEKIWGYVFQGRASEGLTCNALEWLYSSGAGRIVDENGQVTVNNPEAQKILSEIASWIGEISPRGVLNYSEEEARGVFQSGNAIFMRNWPYVWALANAEDSPVKGKIGIAPLPAVEDNPHAATLGGWGLAVSKYSKNKEQAKSLVRYLTSKEEQKRRVIEASFNPTRRSLYADEDVQKALPHIGDLKTAFENAIARPASAAGRRYSRVSNEFWNSVHSVLSNQKEAAEALAELEQRLKRMIR